MRKAERRGHGAREGGKTKRTRGTQTAKLEDGEQTAAILTIATRRKKKLTATCDSKAEK